MSQLFIEVIEEGVLTNSSANVYVTTSSVSINRLYDLSDVTSTYTGKAGGLLAMNAAETSSNFIKPTNGISSNGTVIELDVDGLPVVSSAAPTDHLVISDGTTNKKVTKEDFLIDSTAMSKSEFFAIAEKRKRDSVGSGDAHTNMKFGDYFTTPATTANQFTLEAKTREIDGIKFHIPQTNLTLPDASAVSTLTSNQTLVMCESSLIDITTSDTFYAGCNGDVASVVWSTLTPTQRTNYTQDFKNNIFSDNGKLNQYIFTHVVTNLGQDYEKGDPQAIIDAGYTQGTVGDTFVPWTKAGVVATGVAQIQRRNQGAYHPSFNPEGCGYFVSDGGLWYTTNEVIASTSDTFPANASSGFLAAGGGSGRTHDDKFYDAIYASDVQDLRMSSKRLPLAEIREKYKRMAIAGEVRGFEGVPFTRVFNQVAAATYSNSIDIEDASLWRRGDFCQIEDGTGNWVRIKVVFISIFGSGTIVLERSISRVVGHVLHETKQLHSQANPTWTDIIGSPANIAATFPNGVEGKWIPVIPDGTSKEFPFSRKMVSSSLNVFSGYSGGTWVISGLTEDLVNNSYTNGEAGTQIRIWSYETQAHFTQDDVNSEVLDLGGVYASARHETSWGGLQTSSIIGKVPVSSNTIGGEETSISTFTINTINKNLWNTAPSLPTHAKLDKLGNIASPALKVLDYLSQENNVAKLNYAYKEMVYDSTQDNVSEFIGVSVGTSYAYTVGEHYYLTHTDFGKFRYYGVTALAAITWTAVVISTLQVEAGGKYLINGAGVRYYEIWDGNGWGDNNQFEILDNQGTQTDDNGNSVLYGTASFNTQYFIVES